MMNENIRKALLEKELKSGLLYENEPIENKINIEQPRSLGKIENFKDLPNAGDLGWKNLPISLIPSKGISYPIETRILIRPALVKEVRHYSTIDDEDQLDINDKFNFILSRCSSIQFMNEEASYKDLAKEDRFFILMAIRDITFPNGENRIILQTDNKKCKNETSVPCPFSNGIELKSGLLNHYDIPENLLKYYNEETRSFLLIDNESKIEFFIPTIGVSEKIDKWINNRKIPVDADFRSIAPYLFRDWRDIDDSVLEAEYKKIDHWSIFKFSLMDEVSRDLTFATKLKSEFSCPNCSAEVTAPIYFRKGLRYIFVIPDIVNGLSK